MKGKHTVCRPVTEKQEYTYYECVPKTTKVEHSYYICVPVTKTVKQTYTVCVPEIRKENRQAVSHVCEVVPVVQRHQVVCYTPQVVAYAPPGCGSCCPPVCTVQCVPSVHEVACTSYQTVTKPVVHNYTVDVCTFRHEQRTQDVSYVENTTQLKKEMVDVVTYEHQPRKQTVDVQVMKPFEEEYTYTVCDTVAKTRDIDVTTCVTKTRIVKQPVTYYQTVTKCVTDMVPVTVCVPVPCPAPYCH
jgi:hypothetical protein